MIATAFLICALAPRPMSIPSATAVRVYQMMRSEEDKLVDWIRKVHPDAEVFIHPDPQEGKLKDHGWERVPMTWKGKQIWIKRKPDENVKHRAVEMSA